MATQPDPHEHLTPEEAYMRLHPWPEYMTALGLSPPASEEDVEEAYKTKLAELDAQSATEQKKKELKTCYEQARKFDGLQSSRRKWLSKQVERYVEQEMFIAEIESRGGKVETESIDWIKVSFGDDFAQVADSIGGIDFHGATIGDDDLAWLKEHEAKLSGLHKLSLANTEVSNEGLAHLGSFPALRLLDLRNTAISMRGLKVLAKLPKLRVLGLGGTRVGRFGRWRLGMKYPHLNVQ
ncbi:MAG: hypothetical protein DWQ35_01575 [Planctomycetota bacterium]|nr:MAG: hypothetical protein DWQ35_01575 [Planctomycetota bacterium]REK23003.1 MAG: hypothetical protein DWQ42_15875 [Planctomycetota bacterium]REK43366.1 MAG: hypothetical protein DWQ46_11575 [Planctomycetota bacterium]